mmetsp:Transcript_8106/g.23955  ORF Transcript_8106/g.23955 Transcript_8106/m.23955 type:complete len:220 (-) Transcript_8106:1066-1725(-)
MVVRRTDLNNLHSAETLLGNKADQFESLAGQQAAGLGPPGTRHERGLDAVDVITHVDGIASIPRAFQGHFGNLVDAELLDVVHGKDVGLAFDHVWNRGTGHLPAANANLHEVLWIHVGQVGRVKIRRGVHAFVEILFLNVRMAVHVDDANVFGGDRCQSSDRRESNGMIALQSGLWSFFYGSDGRTRLEEELFHAFHMSLLELAIRTPRMIGIVPFDAM